MTGNHNHRMETLSSFGRRGQAEDVDYLMSILLNQDEMSVIKIVDYVLGLVDTAAGQERLRYYLIHGETIQRNYAALYFKRMGKEEILARAVALGKIDPIQAYAR